MIHAIKGFSLDLPEESLKAALVVSLLSVWVLIGLFFYLNRYTRRHYFNVWTGAWLFYAVWLTLNLSFPLATDIPLVVMLRQWCLGGTVTLLLWGSAEFLQKLNRPLIFGLFVGFLLVWSYVGAYHLDSRLQAQLPVFGLIGAASLFTGYSFLHFRRQSGYLGAGLLAFGFSLWGLHLGSVPLVANSATMASAAFFISAVLQLFIAVSMIVLVLEEVRSDKERLRRQMLVADSEKALIKSRLVVGEERYRQLFDTAGDGIIVAEATNLRILELNQAAGALLGVPPAKAGGRCLLDFIPVAGGGLGGPDQVKEWLNTLLHQPEATVVRPDGRQTPVTVKATRVDWSGRPAIQLCLHDLSARVQLEAQLRQADKLTALGSLIAGMAHELNNPLATINGFADLLLARPDLPDKTRAQLETMAREGRRASDLVRRFAVFSHPQNQRRQSTDLRPLLRRLSELVRFHPLARNVEVLLDLDANLPAIMADEDQLSHALSNLISNALQAMETQTAPRRLLLAARPGEHSVRLSVEDSGPGVPESLQARVFEPFFTTREVGRGAGLGLPITRRIVEDHQGAIVCGRSSLGGAAFVITLPLENTDSGSAGKPATATSTNTRARAPRLRVLVVDDDEPLAGMLGEMVEMLGHQPTICTAARVALKTIETTHFDVIFSDYRMPDLNGEEFYRQIVSRHPRLANKFVFLTGDAGAGESQIFFDRERVQFIYKPFDINVIKAVLESQMTVQIAG